MSSPITHDSALLVAEIVAWPVTATDASLLPGKAPKSTVAVPIPFAIYAIRTTAVPAAAAGSVIVNVPAVEVTVPPKSCRLTAGIPESVSL